VAFRPFVSPFGCLHNSSSVNLQYSSSVSDSEQFVLETGDVRGGYFRQRSGTGYSASGGLHWATKSPGDFHERRRYSRCVYTGKGDPRSLQRLTWRAGRWRAYLAGMRSQQGLFMLARGICFWCSINKLVCILFVQVKREEWGGMFIDLGHQDVVADRSIIKAVIQESLVSFEC